MERGAHRGNIGLKKISVIFPAHVKTRQNLLWKGGGDDEGDERGVVKGGEGDM